MRLIKSSFFLVISTGVKIALGIVSIKVIAEFIGSAGFGKMGQFMSLISVIGISAGGGISNGIISNISKNREKQSGIDLTISGGFWIGVFFSTLIGLILFVFSDLISKYLFKDIIYSIYIKLLACMQFFLIFPVIFGGYLNGLQKSKDFSILTIISAFLGTLLVIFFVVNFSFDGALLGVIFLTISPGIVFLIYYFLKLKSNISIFKISVVSKITYKKLLNHSLMLLFSAIIVPASQILIRGFILEKSNWNDVGFWQASLKMSESGLVFLNVILTNYYLPELGKIKDRSEYYKLFFNTYKILVPILILYIAFVWLFKFEIIELLFSSDFKKAGNLLVWQAIGDSFKVLTLVLGYFVVHLGKAKIYIILESLLFGTITLLSYLLIHKLGVLGANYSYMISYLLLFLGGIVFLFFKRKLFI